MEAISTIIENITSAEQFDRVLNQKPELFMVLFYTESSAKSQHSLKALEQLKKNNADLPIYKIDASRVRDIHPRYDIHAVPTLIAFRNGKAAEIISGVQTEGFYARLLEKPAIYSSKDSNGQTHRVTVYTTPTCPYCDMVKKYLNSKNVSYSEVDVASDRQAASELVQRTGQQGVPQTDIDGSFVIGYNTKELDRLLNL